MTPTQLRAILSRLGLTMAQVGSLMGYADDGRAVRRWTSGERPVPLPVATLLRLLEQGKITADDIY